MYACIGCYGKTEENFKRSTGKSFRKEVTLKVLKNQSECNRQMKDGRVVQSKEIAYAIHRRVIMDKKEGFHTVSEWVERLEEVRDEDRGVGQSQTKKTIRRHK